jgi:hypothetical protein
MTPDWRAQAIPPEDPDERLRWTYDRELMDVRFHVAVLELGWSEENIQVVAQRETVRELLREALGVSDDALGLIAAVLEGFE